MVLVGISVGCLMGCFRAPQPCRKTAPLKRPIKKSMSHVSMLSPSLPLAISSYRFRQMSSQCFSISGALRKGPPFHGSRSSSEIKSQNASCHKTASFEWSRSYREINQHPGLPWNFINHGFLDPSAFPELDVLHCINYENNSLRVIFRNIWGNSRSQHLLERKTVPRNYFSKILFRNNFRK